MCLKQLEEGTMNKFEKYENAIALGPVSNKQDIPVYAHMCTYPAVATGITQADLFKSNDIWLNAMVKTYEKLEAEPDIVFPMGPADVTFIEQLPVKIPGKDLGENELFQFIEKEVMKEDDYHTIIEKGLAAWQFPYVAAIQNPPIPCNEKMFETVGKKFMEAGMHAGKNTGFWAQRGVPTMFQGGTAPAFDMFSMCRSLEPFFFDLYDEPELVKKAMEAATPQIIDTALMHAQPGSKISVFAMRSSATFVSPDMFEEFCWPGLKQMIEAFYAKGVTAIIHADGNWLPMLPFFKEVPKGSCILELDGDTDIVKAKEILNGYQCIRGDLPPAILAFGTAEETQKYCDKLIDLAKDGGFIIGNGCEIPLNSKEENLKIFLNCCR